MNFTIIIDCIRHQCLLLLLLSLFLLIRIYLDYRPKKLVIRNLKYYEKYRAMKWYYRYFSSTHKSHFYQNIMVLRWSTSLAAQRKFVISFWDNFAQKKKDICSSVAAGNGNSNSNSLTPITSSKQSVATNQGTRPPLFSPRFETLPSPPIFHILFPFLCCVFVLSLLLILSLTPPPP